VKRIVELHQGTVEVTSTLEKEPYLRLGFHYTNLHFDLQVEFSVESPCWVL